MAALGAASGGPLGTAVCGTSVCPGPIAPGPPDGANCCIPGWIERVCCAEAADGASISITAAATMRSRAPFPNSRPMVGVFDRNQGNFMPQPCPGEVAPGSPAGA